MRRMNSAEEITAPINVGNPAELKMRQLFAIVIEMPGANSKIVRRPLPVDAQRQRRTNITQAGIASGWEHTVSLREGVRPAFAVLDGMLRANGYQVPSF